MTGGEGEDEVVVQASQDGTATTVMDFQPGQDKLLVSWEGEENPVVQVEPDAEDENLTNVMINGQNVAQLLGAEGLTPDDIQLIGAFDLTQLSALG